MSVFILLTLASKRIPRFKDWPQVARIYFPSPLPLHPLTIIINIIIIIIIIITIIIVTQPLYESSVNWIHEPAPPPPRRPAMESADAPSSAILKGSPGAPSTQPKHKKSRRRRRSTQGTTQLSLSDKQNYDSLVTLATVAAWLSSTPVRRRGLGAEPDVRLDPHWRPSRELLPLLPPLYCHSCALNP